MDFMFNFILISNNSFTLLILLISLHLMPTSQFILCFCLKIREQNYEIFFQNLNLMDAKLTKFQYYLLI